VILKVQHAQHAAPVASLQQEQAVAVAVAVTALRQVHDVDILKDALQQGVCKGRLWLSDGSNRSIATIMAAINGSGDLSCCHHAATMCAATRCSHH
jgi:hypothetical protein